jgi:hypothetical protein
MKNPGPNLTYSIEGENLMREKSYRNLFNMPEDSVKKAKKRQVISVKQRKIY